MISKAGRVKVRKFHRWFGIVIGIQLLFWLGSGAYFAWMPHKVIKNEDRKADPALPAVSLAQVVPLQSLPLTPGFELKSLRLENTPRGVLYRVEGKDTEPLVFDALTGKPAVPLPEAQAVALAMKQVTIEDRTQKAQLLSTAPAEYKGPLPVYQIALDDFRETHLYADPWTGKILAQRNRFWRVYDFLWMLHILDFKEREDFNNALLQSLSLGALVLVLSGYALFLFGRAPRRNSAASEVSKAP